MDKDQGRRGGTFITAKDQARIRLGQEFGYGFGDGSK